MLRHVVVLPAFRTEDWSLALTVTAGAQHTAAEAAPTPGHFCPKLDLPCDSTVQGRKVR